MVWKNDPCFQLRVHHDWGLIRTIHTPKLFKRMFTDIILHRFWAIYGNLVYFIIFLTSSTSCLSSFCVAAVWYGLVAIICPESCPPFQMRSCHNAEIYPEMNLATRYITNRALKINMESKTYIYIYISYIVYTTNLHSKTIRTKPPFLCSIFLFNWVMFRFHSSIFQGCSGSFEHCFDFNPSPFIQSDGWSPKASNTAPKADWQSLKHGGKTLAMEGLYSR